jgi:hypothetical protein
MNQLDSIRGSAAHTALKRLRELGGDATVEQLRRAILSEFRSNGRFQQLVQTPLERRMLILVTGEQVRLTPQGRSWLLRMEPGAKEHDFTVKNAYKPQPWGQNRTGALDYQSKPSLMAGQSVPYRHGRQTGDEESNG